MRDPCPLRFVFLVLVLVGSEYVHLHGLSKVSHSLREGDLFIVDSVLDLFADPLNWVQAHH